uniref:Uncharacterized protein n=1 Tax=Steinernema glaseri TaxID=37863 RepID=A0A1I7ZZC1_9BILA
MDNSSRLRRHPPIEEYRNGKEERTNWTLISLFCLTKKTVYVRTRQSVCRLCLYLQRQSTHARLLNVYKQVIPGQWPSFLVSLVPLIGRDGRSKPQDSSAAAGHHAPPHRLLLLLHLPLDRFGLDSLRVRKCLHVLDLRLRRRWLHILCYRPLRHPAHC